MVRFLHRKILLLILQYRNHNLSGQLQKSLAEFPRYRLRPFDTRKISRPALGCIAIDFSRRNASFTPMLLIPFPLDIINLLG